MSYLTYSLSDIFRRIHAAGFGAIDCKHFSNKPVTFGISPVVFDSPVDGEGYVIVFGDERKMYYRDGPFGVVLTHYFDSTAKGEIEGEAIDVHLYRIWESADTQSTKIACIQFFSTSKGARTISQVSEVGLYDLSMMVENSRRITCFFEAFLGLEPS